MKRLFISFAGMAMLVGSSFAVTTSESSSLLDDKGTQNEYQTIQLETDNGQKVQGVLSQEEADKLRNHTTGDKVKLHINGDLGHQGSVGHDVQDTTVPTSQDGLGTTVPDQDSQDTTVPNGVE